jgi:ADP-ribosyl-[dinitrogen reductase] hydrolase
MRMSGLRTVGGVQRAIGCLVGAAVGDALGAPFEFGPAGQWSRRFPEPVLGGIGEMVGGGGFAWAPGQFTDDTEMAVIVAESLLACGGFDADDQLARFRAWGVHANDVGNLTREVLGCGLPAAEAAQRVLDSRRGRHTAGNGSIMRVASGALHFAPAGREATVAAALALSAVTHADALCQWSVAVAHEMIRLALEGDNPFEGVDAVVAMMPAVVRTALEPLLDASWTPSAGGPSNGSAMGALAQAVWALRTNDSFAGAVTAVIDLGDDTDSVAAVTGALAGARWGIQQIPSRWQTYVHGVVTGADGQTRTYDHTHLHAMARALVGWPQPFDGGDEPVLEPAEVVPGVWASNRSGASSVDEEFAVVSLCRIEPSSRRPVRREVYLVDKPGEANASLDAVLDDVLDTIDAFLAEGRQVLVHCHGGRSRTGLVLAGHLMRQGMSLDEAMALLAQRWLHAHLRSESFAELVQAIEETHGL